MTGDLDTAVYEAEARAARARIAETVTELQQRLDPRALANQAMDVALERGSSAARQVRDSVAEHALGVAAVGVGVGLLFGAGHYLKRGKTPTMQYEDEYEDDASRKDRLAAVKDTAGHVRDAVAQKAGAARETAAAKLVAARDYTAESWDAARERASDYAHRARDGAQRARERTADGIDSNPLTAALIGAAVGALVGALLPSTRRENRTFGKARDRVADQARAAARAARDAGKARFDELGIKDQARAELERLKESASDIARKAGDAARASRKD